jgi:pimeloyl-ACP methyl ester carboxylesterase
MNAFWYQPFHQLDLAEQLVDGKPDAVRTYLQHFWRTWSGPDFELDPEAFEQLVSAYSPPGAFVASIGWYRAGAGAVAKSLAEQPPAPADRSAVPTTVLWPELHLVDGAGHFTPLECPQRFAELIRARLA